MNSEPEWYDKSSSETDVKYSEEKIVKSSPSKNTACKAESI